MENVQRKRKIWSENRNFRSGLLSLSNSSALDFEILKSLIDQCSRAWGPQFPPLVSFWKCCLIHPILSSDSRSEFIRSLFGINCVSHSLFPVGWNKFWSVTPRMNLEYSGKGPFHDDLVDLGKDLPSSDRRMLT